MVMQSKGACSVVWLCVWWVTYTLAGELGACPGMILWLMGYNSCWWVHADPKPSKHQPLLTKYGPAPSPCWLIQDRLQATSSRTIPRPSTEEGQAPRTRQTRISLKPSLKPSQPLPDFFRTGTATLKSQALFKARALAYCIGAREQQKYDDPPGSWAISVHQCSQPHLHGQAHWQMAYAHLDTNTHTFAASWASTLATMGVTFW